MEQIKTAVIVTRFWGQVDRRRAEECWPWTGYIEDGYGRFFFDGRMRGAHELAVTFSTGEERLAHLDTCHSRECVTPLCCNPGHLRFDTRQSNVDDMMAMGRFARPSARLTVELVREMRERRAAGAPQRLLAEHYGISEASVSVIVRGLQWGDAGGPIQSKNEHYIRNEA